MASYTITTAVNIDTLTAKTGNDTYTINGGFLTVDQHSRYGTNQNTSATMGNIPLSATLGGQILFDSRLVRLIAYNTGSGTVPAYDTVISRGAASAKLLCVYATLASAPTAPGAGMPASGFILVRQWNSTPYTAGVLTGITATATEADRAGWLEIVGAEAATITVNRLNLFQVRGAYFDFLGVTTTGTRTTTYQLPSNGAAVYVPGVEVETDVAGVYEFYPCAGTRPALLANIATDTVRGKWCWITTAGLVSFGFDGTNSTGGYCPPAGRKIRVANIFFNAATTAAPTVNALPNATLATRPEFLTTGGGALDIDKASVGWYLNLNQPYSVALSNVSTFESITLSECAAPIAWTNVGVGQSAANSQTALVMSLNFQGGTLTNCVWSRAALGASGNYILSITDCDGLSFIDCRTASLTKNGNATSGTALLTRVASTTLTNLVLGGGQLWMATCTDVTATNSVYYDNPATTTASTIPFYAFSVSTGCLRITIDGLSFGGLVMCQPYSGVLNVLAAGCKQIKLRNLGTYASPLSMGDVRRDSVSWTRVTTTGTITSADHGLKVGDSFYVVVSDNTAAITVALKTVATVPSSSTFTFAVTNSGSTSGVLSYFPCMCANLIVFANAAAAVGVKVQRCYTPHTRTNLYTADNSSTEILFENVIGDYLNAFVTPTLNTTFRGISGTPALTAQTSVYGTHWLDVYNADVTPNLVNQSWTRASTVCTVTSNDHKLRTGLLINVLVSSDTGAVVLGTKSVTAINSNTFTFACANTGAASGTLTYRTVIDRLAVLMNEPTSETQNQVHSFVGGAAFTSAGGLVLPSVNDSVTFEMPTRLTGLTGFPIYEPVVVGGTLSNYHLEYQLDRGEGFGSWQSLSYPRAGGSGTSGQSTITVTSATGVQIDDYVWGTGIGGLAQVTNIVSNTITLSQPNATAVSGIIRFGRIRNEIDLPTAGIKLKIRATTVTANTSAITSLSVYADTDTTSRAYQYPLDTNTATITGMPTGCDVVVLTAGTSTILAQVDQHPGTSYGYTYSGSQTVDVGIIKPGYVLYYIRNLALTANDSSIPVALTADRNYS